MIETLECPAFWKSDPPKVEAPYVLVQEFNEAAYKRLCEDCQASLAFLSGPSYPL